METFANISENDVTPSPAYFVDARVGKLVDRLRALTYTRFDTTTERWLQFVFPLASHDEKTDEPVIWVPSRGEYVSLIPQDKAYSYAFFYEYDERTRIDSGLWEVSLGLFVWFNRAYFEKGHNIREMLIQLILVQLQFALPMRGRFNGARIATIHEDVFDDFDFRQTNLADAPFDTFLIKFRTIVEEECIYNYEQATDLSEC